MEEQSVVALSALLVIFATRLTPMTMKGLRAFVDYPQFPASKENESSQGGLKSGTARLDQTASDL